MAFKGTGENLSSVRLLASLSEADREDFAGKIGWSSVASGDTVIAHLATEAQVYFVISGALKVSVSTPAGKEVVIRNIGAGDHFGEIAALAGFPRSVAVIAETDAVLGVCSQAEFSELLKRHPLCAISVSVSLAQLVVDLTDRFYELAALDTRLRVCAELVRLSRRGEKTDDGLLIEEAPTHAMMAAAIGSRREAVTREIGDLEEEGVVKRLARRRLLIPNIERLRSELVGRSGQLVTYISS
ncbi:Crp/Fnr family transcriptional regulator [Candidatus Viadribacter manganicus]|uniref:Crp/Fnr family transcriptional regulator n=1 Tax=Candidatus Viadribacter manganicus TaxID=1759059 RepID=UPI001D1700DC|nr:Crp/Fnr family transcriptional regulator [Candidatus Viadribacter manganicus]